MKREKYAASDDDIWSTSCKPIKSNKLFKPVWFLLCFVLDNGNEY